MLPLSHDENASLDSFCCLFPSWAHAYPILSVFFLLSPLCGYSSLLLAFLAFSSLPLPACLHGPPRPHRFSPRSRTVACCWAVSVGCLASVQGPVSSPFPSLHLLAQTSAPTLRLAGGSCPVLKWVVCEGVGIPCAPCSLASARLWRGGLLSGRRGGSQQAGAGPGMLIGG